MKRSIVARSKIATALAAAVIWSLTAVTVQSPSADAASTIVRTFDHNVRLTSIGAIDYISRTDAPLMITAQEVCRSQYTTLKSRLASRGYTVWGIAGVSNSGPCRSANGTTQDGAISLVASLGSSPGGPVRAFFGPQASGDSTRRGYVCLKSTTYLLTWRLCSTHITPNSVYYAVAQADAMRNVALYINDRAVIVGGDFSRRPYESGPAAWTNSFSEADGSRNLFTYDIRNRLTKKIDYIFAIRLRTDSGYGAARVGCSIYETTSDHCFIHGYLRFLQ